MLSYGRHGPDKGSRVAEASISIDGCWGPAGSNFGTIRQEGGHVVRRLGSPRRWCPLNCLNSSYGVGVHLRVWLVVMPRGLGGVVQRL